MCILNKEWNGYDEASKGAFQPSFFCALKALGHVFGYGPIDMGYLYNSPYEATEALETKGFSVWALDHGTNSGTIWAVFDANGLKIGPKKTRMDGTGKTPVRKCICNSKGIDKPPFP